MLELPGIASILAYVVVSSPSRFETLFIFLIGIIWYLFSCSVQGMHFWVPFPASSAAAAAAVGSPGPKTSLVTFAEACPSPGRWVASLVCISCKARPEFEARELREAP